MDKSKISVILSEGWVGPRGAKDLRDDRGSAPGFVRRSFAPTPAPTLSLRMTLGWFWALDNELRNDAHKHREFLGSKGWGSGGSEGSPHESRRMFAASAEILRSTRAPTPSLRMTQD